MQNEHNTHRAVSDRFWPKVDKAESGCWSWRAGTTKRGYGVIRDGTGRQRGAHCIAWEMASGETLPPGAVVGHTCDNPACVRNDEAGTYEIAGKVLPRYGHLFKGTQPDNVRDMWDKGRSDRGDDHFSRRQPELVARGERKSKTAKLTEHQVHEMRAEYQRGGVSHRELAARYGVSQGNVTGIIQRKSWAHVP